VGATQADGQLTWQALIDPLSVDPDDPLGLLNNLPPGVTLPPGPPNTWSTPLIVATATDQDSGDTTKTGFQFGLYEPYDTTNKGNFAQTRPDPAGGIPYWRDALYGLITNHQQ
jgi:hypothetical protein